MSIEKKEMVRVLHDEQAFAGKFINYMLERNVKIETDLVDELFNSGEERLARALLILARYGKEDEPQTTVPKISQGTLAERHDPEPCKFLHEQIQEAGIH
jgi:hypothetical protein